MAIKIEDAFVVKRIPLRETSLFVTFFTKGAGKIKAVVKGARRERNSTAAKFEPFTRLSVVYYEKIRSDTHLVSDASVIESNWLARRRLDHFSYGSYMMELIDALFDLGDPHGEVFDLIVDTFRLFQSAPLERLVRIFEFKILHCAGFLPSLMNCVVCGKGECENVFFSPKQGGIVCSDCDPRELGTFKVSNSSIRILLAYFRMGMKEASGLDVPEVTFHQLKRIGRKFIQYRLEYPLHSPRFIAQIKPFTEVSS